ncbi:MAG: 50S ribosomal protein L6 [Bacteroidia bacterium]|nr:50S ribosomal protein L6 [Bacteroidia bacterium]
MSRIGKQPIALPKGVTITRTPDMVAVKGPKGELKQALSPDFTLEVAEAELSVQRPTDQKRHRALHGLYRALIQNMVVGVSEGYETRLELVGVGYRAEVKGNRIEFALGYSHPIVLVLPEEIKAEVELVKGKAPVLILRCIDKQLLGLVVAKIRSLRKPEPYKGKGIRFLGEIVRRKAGKTAGKGKK